MNPPLDFREATKADLPDILRLLAQPDLDGGTVLPLAEAERLFERMARYPDYNMIVALRDGRAMMRHALRLCGEKGCYKVALSSNLARERAHAFYESLGFERHGCSFRITLPAPLAED